MHCPYCGALHAEGASFCNECGKPLSSPPPSDGRTRDQPTTGPKNYASGKSPIVACLLSLVMPGIGQFYNGDAKKGGTMLVAYLIAWPLAVSTGILFLAVFLLVVWSAVDAYRVAKGTAPLW